MITCIPLAFGWLAIVVADSAAWLYLGRVLTGVANGMLSLVTSVYVTEVASSNARGLENNRTAVAYLHIRYYIFNKVICYQTVATGMLGTVNQIASSFGVLVVYVLPFAMDYKWLAIYGCAKAALTMILMTVMPETPR